MFVKARASSVRRQACLGDQGSQVPPSLLMRLRSTWGVAWGLVFGILLEGGLISSIKVEAIGADLERVFTCRKWHLRFMVYDPGSFRNRYIRLVRAQARFDVCSHDSSGAQLAPRSLADSSRMESFPAFSLNATQTEACPWMPSS